jgi:hypothetical protein
MSKLALEFVIRFNCCFERNDSESNSYGLFFRRDTQK